MTARVPIKQAAELIRRLRREAGYPYPDSNRAAVYGGGIFRTTTYPNGGFGVEWRDPDNGWCKPSARHRWAEDWLERVQSAATDWARESGLSVVNPSPTLGADPELFARIGGRITPVRDGWDMPAKADEAIRLSAGGLLADNVMAEITPRPSTTPNELLENVQQLIAEAEEWLSARTGQPVHLIAKASHRFRAEEWAGSEQSAAELGCSPDWILADNRLGARRRAGASTGAPTAASLGDWRYAGGHIHIGWLPAE